MQVRSCVYLLCCIQARPQWGYERLRCCWWKWKYHI